MTNPKTIRVLLVDDHVHVHEAIAETLALSADILLVAQAQNGLDAITLCNKYRPDVILMDIVMPKMNGIEATKQILEAHPNVKILALSSFQDRASVRSMLASGAVGYVLKDDGTSDLEEIIHAAYKGKTVLSSDITHVLLESPEAIGASAYGLTSREVEVLRLIAQGLRHGEVATSLNISYSTVRFHVTNIISKMGAKSRTEAISLAAKAKII